MTLHNMWNISNEIVIPGTHTYIYVDVSESSIYLSTNNFFVFYIIPFYIGLMKIMILNYFINNYSFKV